ncbi:hypothetical protein AAV99_12070 [Aurantiacibacter marinus]|uniref:Phage tail collar domain-containing protein n=1 Tax=Aurantiacibacter marinus TaxID=874156 RepID=A0A0H0XRV2_9SPHN|nr:hypothetical protein AAV99_12070 [Aurantiacibacter marinus]
MAGSFYVSSPAQAQDSYLGTVELSGYNFCRRGTVEANGALLLISQNQALFSLFGTIYGGDGRTTFAMPDLRGRVPFHRGTNQGGATYQIGSRSGTETNTLTVNQMPSHSHTAGLSVNALESNTNQPARSYPAVGPAGTNTYYRGQKPPYFLAADAFTIFPTGGNQSVNNMQPYLTMNYCVVTQGIFPSRN